ncbi:MAG: hypothetical protein IKO84_06810 [Butyrivibrio sp.]|nr:hypothetical protein [Butyrivibrio sp.]
MDNKIVHVLNVFSSCLASSPKIEFDGMNMIIELKGYDDNEKYHECRIRFESVIGYKYSLALFEMIKGSYDTIIEIMDSEWRDTFEKNNKEQYDYWKPKHYALYLDEVGLYQVLAKKVIVEET